MRIGYFQFDSTNPYQTRFYQAVAQAGAEVVRLTFSSVFPFRDRDDVDVVHLDWLHPFYASRRGRLVQSVKTWSAMHQIRRARKLRRPRFVHTIHNITCHDSYLPPVKEKRIVNRFLASMDGLVGFSPAVFEHLDQRFDLPKDQQRFVIPHGHYIDSYSEPPDQESSRRELGLPLEPPIVLFFGHLRESKGILDLLSVFPEVHEKTGAVLVVAGSVDSPSVSSALANTHDDVRTFPHCISSDDVPKFFAAADIVALPFRSILNSGSAILAASMGKYTVMPDIPTLHANLYCPAIQLYPPADTAGLMESLINVIQIPRDQLRRRGAEGRAHAQDKLCWSRIGASAFQMYENILAA